MSLAEAFEPIRSALERTGVRYAVGGSWASTAFGEPRFTNDIDILAEFTDKNLGLFVSELPDGFYVDSLEASMAIRNGRSFNVIHMATTFKFDFFPAAAFALGREELDRSIHLMDTGLSKAAVPFVTPEDILLAKLYWFQSGGEASETQWRDIKGIVRACADDLDRSYLQQGASRIGVLELLGKAFSLV